MAVRATDAARRICELGQWKVTNLALQKILYIAHMVHMGRHGAPLVNGKFEAWDYGPVHPDLYHRVKAFGEKPIPDIFRGALDLRGSTEGHTIDEACSHLLRRRPAELVAMTHRSNGAWARHYVPGTRGVIIPDGDIVDEYRARVAA